MDECELIQVNIHDEPTGRVIAVDLTRLQLERAQRDTEYVAEIIRDYDSNNANAENQSQPDSNNSNAADQREPESRSIFIWNEQCVNLLLSLYEEHKEEFGCKRHKSVYELIAKKMKEVNENYDVTGLQCQSKIISLKKTYKKIIDHNSTSGNDRATWPYLEIMNQVFGTTGWAQPVAVASELGPEVEEHPTTPPNIETQSKKRKFDAAFEEYRKDLLKHRAERNRVKQENFNMLLELKEKHHREKMEILKQLLPNNRIN